MGARLKRTRKNEYEVNGLFGGVASSRVGTAE